MKVTTTSSIALAALTELTSRAILWKVSLDGEFLKYFFSSNLCYFLAIDKTKSRNSQKNFLLKIFFSSFEWFEDTWFYNESQCNFIPLNKNAKLLYWKSYEFTLNLNLTSSTITVMIGKQFIAPSKTYSLKIELKLMPGRNVPCVTRKYLL